MRYQEIKPPAALQHLVRFFWVLEYNGAPEFPVQYKLLAEGFPGLVFFFKNQYGAINGQTTGHRTFSMAGNFKMVGVYLYPYALPLLFRIPSVEFTHQHIPLSDLYKTEFADLQDRLLETETDAQGIHILADYLYKKSIHATGLNDKFHQCIQYVIKQHGNVGVDQLAQQVGISNRQLERKFSFSVGLPPKVFSRLMRFHTSLRFLKSDTIESLTDIAYAAGYFDQSHFIRDFKEFAGLSPGEYISLPTYNRADNFIQLL
jgi:AraC-like DNA-binding protein